MVDQEQHPLMPTTPARARRWIREGKATGFWKRGVFCVRLNVPPSAWHTQPVAVGIDPGSKREGLVVAAAAHTYLNVQAVAVDWVKDAVATRRTMRRGRRSRKTPYRANRRNRQRGGLPPSTKARWGWKLRLARWLARLYPVSVFVVEDVAATSKTGQRRWNSSFSPLEVGKRWFYGELQNVAPVSTRHGWETKQYRDALGLPKAKDKLAECWDAHCKGRVSLHALSDGRRLTQNAQPADLRLRTFASWRTRPAPPAG
ncbi:MAG TPA: RRXRR domain-containing protein [Chloroflexia bacterium]|nr:RRXRR domain-containing protein [Chloroflexia bacterium]